MKKAPRIYFLVSKSDVGGATIYVHNLMEEFKESSITYLYQGDSSNSIDGLGPTILCKEKLSVSDYFVAISKLKRFLNSVKDGVVSVHSSEAAILLRIASFFSLRRHKIVYTVHGWGWRGKNKVIKHSLMLFELILYYAVRCHYVFLYEGMARESYWMTFNKKRYDVISTGIIINNSYIKHIGENRRYNVLFPARLDYAKRHVDAINILKQLPALTLTFVGHGTDSKDFKKMIFNECQKSNVDSRRVIFHGLTRNISKFYQSHGIVLLISRFEALPMVLLEAASFGCLTVANDVGGNSTIVKDMHNGILLNNELEFSNIQLEFLRNYLQKDTFAGEVHNRAKSLIKEKFSRSVMSTNYYKLFAKI